VERREAQVGERVSLGVLCGFLHVVFLSIALDEEVIIALLR
jgi:hypothetical protein